MTELAPEPAPRLHAVPGMLTVRNFKAIASEYQRRYMRDEAQGGVGLTVMYAGVAAEIEPDGKVKVGVSVHDGTYCIDFCIHRIDATANATDSKRSSLVAEFVISELQKYQRKHLSKFLGAGLTHSISTLSPDLCGKIWMELDCVPMSFESKSDNLHEEAVGSYVKGQANVDERADSMARKCVLLFGPNQQPRLDIGFRNMVNVDSGFHAHLARLEQYRRTVGSGTWNAVEKYVNELKERKVKIAFFNSTPQGGGVALMRHALIRFLRLMNVDAKWYVPKPSPDVFRITKTNHNILQGVAAPSARMTTEQKKAVTDWITFNARRYWLSKGGPLASPSEGGADIVIIDDPQMPGLIPLAKKEDPKRMVIYRSHIEVRSDLVHSPGSPQQDLWNYLWNDIKLADVFISHPVSGFVPDNVPKSMVGYMPATTDWLDGLNKSLGAWDLGYYLHKFNVGCREKGQVKLRWPACQYITQIARFDLSKGIPDVIETYAQFRQRLENKHHREIPQLLICGHGAIDDPDASIVYDQTMELLETTYADIRRDVVVMPIGPSDQMLNALLSASRVVLQLSTREGFEIKVSEALRKGKPVVATKAGGIPLQIEHGKNGFLVDIGDTKQASRHLYELWTDGELYQNMSRYASWHVSDEVGTVGNSLSWLYLAAQLSKGELSPPNGRWINDIARETARQPYEPEEPRLPRN
ncbi:MAG: hypothetical protein M1829_004378 [Trizodia sp. TS-e1964]|nr:MAG: hypothetical protein M1829_004378 [Trizodia sp. TS-e1964]